MREDKAKERFVADYGDEVKVKSQCIGCNNNIGRDCKAFGKKPWKYQDALSKEKCPRKLVK